MNCHIRDTLRRGPAYARALGGLRAAVRPEARARAAASTSSATSSRGDDPDLDAHAVLPGRLVTMRILTFKCEFGLDVYIDHGIVRRLRSSAELAEEIGVPAILGPREVMSASARPRYDTDGRDRRASRLGLPARRAHADRLQHRRAGRAAGGAAAAGRDGRALRLRQLPAGRGARPDDRARP